MPKYANKLGWFLSYSVIARDPRLGLLEGVGRALAVLVCAWSGAIVLVFLDLSGVDDPTGVKGGGQSLAFLGGVALAGPYLLRVPCRFSPISLLRVAT